MKRRWLVVFLTAAMIFISVCFGGCGNQNREEQGGDQTVTFIQTEAPKAGEEIAVIKTNYGEIQVQFFPEQAPKAVENFKTHAREGYYNGLIFHRVINDFMIQGGDPEGTGMGGESIWGKAFEDEFSDKLHNFRGALSMANSGANTNGSQFFIVQKSAPTEQEIAYYKQLGYLKDDDALIDAYRQYGGTPWLDGHHTVFGQVFEGMDVVDQIAAVSVNNKGVPDQDVIIEKIDILEYQG